MPQRRARDSEILVGLVMEESLAAIENDSGAEMLDSSSLSHDLPQNQPVELTEASRNLCLEGGGSLDFSARIAAINALSMNPKYVRHEAVIDGYKNE